MALFHLLAGAASGVSLWGIACWDAPGPVGQWRAGALLVVSALMGTAAGGLWLLATAIRHVTRLGAAFTDAVVGPWVRGVRAAGGFSSRLRGRGRRTAAWLIAAAWALFALDAALLYLTLY